MTDNSVQRLLGIDIDGNSAVMDKAIDSMTFDCKTASSEVVVIGEIKIDTLIRRNPCDQVNKVVRFSGIV